MRLTALVCISLIITPRLLAQVDPRIAGFGLALPAWSTHGYRAALLSSDPAVHELLETAPRAFSGYQCS